jgi:adenosylcobyric acid synthase
MTQAIMIQGTGSDVGKSLIVAGLARAFSNRGLSVRPFKPQNMSNNAAVTVDGGEIGRAQALQAVAARVAPMVHMNPVLLKPESPTGSQVVVQGKRFKTLDAREFLRQRPALLPAIVESFRLLARNADLILIEGAGSPAETNLRDGDTANMGFAEAVDVDAVLVGDVHRGGVIASIVGTFKVLPPADAARLKGVIVNNFHGDASLFDDGRDMIERMTGTPVLGVVPHFADAARLPAEDSLALERSVADQHGRIRIAVLKLPRIANFDDLDPLRLEPDVAVTFVSPGETIPTDARLVVLPGSKSTIADLKDLYAQGWDLDLKAHVRRGGRVLGICGGYQMLGRAVHDPSGIEGPAGSVQGLGLLDVETTLTREKQVVLTEAVHNPSQSQVAAYEIHLGETAGPDCARPFFHVRGRPEGACSADWRVSGTYLHGCFAGDAFRRSYLSELGSPQGRSFSYAKLIDATLDGLAEHLSTHIDLGRVLGLARVVNA